MIRPSQKTVATLFIVAACLVAATGCGKKGDPTLKAFDKPDTPSSLTAIHREDSITLKWNYPAAAENKIKEFLVLRSAGAGFENLASVEKDKREYSDNAISVGTSYEYKLISKSLRDVISNDSNTVAAAPVIVPASPKGLSFSVSGSSLFLKWDPSDKGLYNVYKRTGKKQYGMKPVNDAPLTVAEYKDAFSVNAVVYYTVRGLTGSGIRDEGPASVELTVNPADFVPDRPANLHAYPDEDKVLLAWTEVDELWVTGFRVYRRTEKGEFEMIGKTQTPTFMDPEAPVTKRDYRVTTVGVEMEGPASEVTGVVFVPQR
jgi:hypothetical protein